MARVTKNVNVVAVHEEESQAGVGNHRPVSLRFISDKNLESIFSLQRKFLKNILYIIL